MEQLWRGPASQSSERSGAARVGCLGGALGLDRAGHVCRRSPLASPVGSARLCLDRGTQWGLLPHPKGAWAGECGLLGGLVPRGTLRPGWWSWGETGDRVWFQEGDRVRLRSPAWCAVGSRAWEAAGPLGRWWGEAGDSGAIQEGAGNLGGSGAIREAEGNPGDGGAGCPGRERGRQQLGLGAGVGLALGSGFHFVAWGSPAASQVTLVTV